MFKQSVKAFDPHWSRQVLTLIKYVYLIYDVCVVSCGTSYAPLNGQWREQIIRILICGDERSYYNLMVVRKNQKSLHFNVLVSWEKISKIEIEEKNRSKYL